MFSKETIKNLPNNNRFYVLLFAFLTSAFVVCLLRVLVVSDQLYYIQLEQIFGFFSITFLYLSLIISPIQKIIGKPEWMKNLIFARRAIGVSALYFALLHAGISLWGQLGGLEGLALLPDRFAWSLMLGLVALIILCMMAITSFDKLVSFLTFPRWKRLQRMVYLSGILIIVHVWTIGAHFHPGSIRNTFFVALVVLCALEAWRLIGFLIERYRWPEAKKFLLFLVFWALGVLLLAGLASFYHPVKAHMILRDTVTGTGAVLHIIPDDDPIAGQPTSFLFDIQDTTLDKQHSVARLIVTDEQNKEVAMPARIAESTVAADYTFPQQGLYKLTLTIGHEGKQIHQFTEGQRVSRGIINKVAVSSTPLWAEVGLLSTAMATIAIACIAFSRRRDITTYSKL